MKTRIFAVGSLLVVLAFSSAGETTTNQPARTNKPAISTSPIPASSPSFVSGWTRQVEKLALAGISEAVIISYVDAAGTFNLSAQEIISLTQAGVPQSVLSAMLQHDAEIMAGTRQVFATSVPEQDTPLFSFKGPAQTAAEPEEQESEMMPELQPQGEPYLAEYAFSPAPQPGSMEVSPVRKPYPEKLTDPIIIYRGYARPANVQLLELFP